MNKVVTNLDKFNCWPGMGKLFSGVVCATACSACISIVLKIDPIPPSLS